jgi:hypothetical protein
MATKKTSANPPPDAPKRGKRTPAPPLHSSIVKDLSLLRQKGITQLRGLKLDALASAVRLTEEAPSEVTYLPQAIEEMLRRAVDRMDEGRYAISAELIFGLARGSRGGNPTDLRREAAERLNIAPETFRKDHEKTTVAELAEAILGLCRDHDMRLARIAMAEHRHPADSRLAIGWAERFEDYYRIWTCVYAVAADLTAYRATLLDPRRTWDQHDEPGRDCPGVC